MPKTMRIKPLAAVLIVWLLYGLIPSGLLAAMYGYDAEPDDFGQAIMRGEAHDPGNAFFAWNAAQEDIDSHREWAAPADLRRALACSRYDGYVGRFYGDALTDLRATGPLRTAGIFSCTWGRRQWSERATFEVSIAALTALTMYMTFRWRLARLPDRRGAGDEARRRLQMRLTSYVIAATMFFGALEAVRWPIQARFDGAVQRVIENGG